jgi:hypothetical protein
LVVAVSVDGLFTVADGAGDGTILLHFRRKPARKVLLHIAEGGEGVIGKVQFEGPYLRVSKVKVDGIPIRSITAKLVASVRDKSVSVYWEIIALARCTSAGVTHSRVVGLCSKTSPQATQPHVVFLNGFLDTLD